MIYQGPITWTISAAATIYVAVPTTCRLVAAFTAVSTTATTVADNTLTFSDGTTDIGKILIAASAVGTIDKLGGPTTGALTEATTAVELNETTPLVIETDGGCTAGAVNLTLVFSEYFSA